MVVTETMNKLLAGVYEGNECLHLSSATSGVQGEQRRRENIPPNHRRALCTQKEGEKENRT